MQPPAAILANRFLERQAWAQQRLAAHAGRSLVVVVGPLSSALAIDASGRVAATTLAGLAPDLTLTLSPLAVPSFLADPSRWSEFVVATGDAALAATLRDLAQTLPWFVEQTFADVLGPIVGQRAADAGRRLLAFPEFAAARLAESFASYARDEAALLAGATELDLFTAHTAELAARTDALAARIEALAARLDTAASGGAAQPKVVTLPRS